MSSKRNIVLVGLSGSGKTTVGQAVADQLKIPFIDTDAMIEVQEDRSIPEIFETDGEAYFRAVESRVLQSLSEIDNTVIATGGGIVIDPNNRKVLIEMGFVYWLNTAPELIVDHIEGDDSRPLLKDENKLEKLQLLLTERIHWYRGVSLYEIRPKSIDIPAAVDQILGHYRRYS